MTNLPSFRKDILPTIAVSLNISQFFIFSLQFLFLFNVYLRYLLLAYYIWIFFVDYEAPDKGTRWTKVIRSSPIWKYAADYYPLRLIKQTKMELDPKKNYLFCVFPHGIMPFAAGIAFTTEALNVSQVFPHHKPYSCTLRFLLNMPISREIMMANGAVVSSKKCLNYLLGHPGGGNMVCLYVGGAQEAAVHEFGRYRLILKNRKGFAKIALENGSPLVPVISFGESDTLGQVKFNEDSWFYKIQQVFKKYTGFVYVIPIGTGISFFKYGGLPIRKPVNVVVGEPIEVPKIENPTQDQVDNIHGEFITKLNQLFEENKERYLENAANIHLEIL